MKIQVSLKETKQILTKSKLPDADYVINPYLGCTHGCIYCYAEFMRRFSQHNEPWGAFIEAKKATEDLDLRKVLPTDTILIGSVTDAYNPFESKYCITQNILKQLSSCVARVEILTKSKLVCRDIALLKSIPNVAVGVSLNTTDDVFRRKTEPYAASVNDRIETLKTLHEAGISTYLFVAPVFPGLTNYQELLHQVVGYVDYVCFENLNLRGSYKARVLSFIAQEYPDKAPLFEKIYHQKDISYWDDLEHNIRQHCDMFHIPCRIYFHHGSFKP